MTKLGRVMAAAALAVCGVTMAVDAQAFEVKKTSRGELVHWESRDVEYVLTPSVEEAVPGSTAATASAIEDWSGAAAAPELHLRAATAADPTRPGNDGQNGVFFMKGGYAPAGRALAVTVLTYDNATGRILDADVVFNGKYDFSIHAAGDPAQTTSGSGLGPQATDGISHDLAQAEHGGSSSYDLHHVVAHELGHSLGMSDELSRGDALMYRYTAANEAGVRAPTSDDVEGLSQLYGTELSAQGGCGGATMSAKKPTAGASTAAMLMTFGLLGFLALRARGSRRARVVFALAAATATVALVPSLSDGAGTARASTLAPGHARARVLETSTSIEDGLVRTAYRIATTSCRAGSCPKAGHGTVWGGTIGNVVQEIGGQHAPEVGDDVDVSFAKLHEARARALSPIAHPLGQAYEPAAADSAVLTLTRAR